MTAKIKLNAASGGGSFSLQAPSSSSNNRVFTLPDSADATLLTSTASLGKVLQVVSSVKTDTASASVDMNSDWVGHGLSVSITPSSASNKILITGQLSVNADINDGISVAIFKAGSVLSGATGDAAGSRNRQTAGAELDYNFAMTCLPFHYLDTAGGTSSITYQPAICISNTGSYTVYLNRTHLTNDAHQFIRTISVITAMEIAG